MASSTNCRPVLFPYFTLDSTSAVTMGINKTNVAVFIVFFFRFLGASAIFPGHFIFISLFLALLLVTPFFLVLLIASVDVIDIVFSIIFVLLFLRMITLSVFSTMCSVSVITIMDPHASVVEQGGVFAFVFLCDFGAEVQQGVGESERSY